MSVSNLTVHVAEEAFSLKDVVLAPSQDSAGRSYKVMKKLGQGGNGIVCEVPTPKGVNRCAAKIGEKNWSSYEAEQLKAAQKARHVLKYRDDFVLAQPFCQEINQRLATLPDRQWHTIIMDKLPCKSIYDEYLVKKNAHHNLSMLHILNIAEQVLETLQDLREQNRSHGDLKPENLAYDGHQLHIFDFGTSKSWEKGSVNTNDFQGTIKYMAPEIFLRYTICDTSHDMWSVGATLFQLYTGRPLVPSEWDSRNPDQSISDHFRLMMQNLGDFNPNMVLSEQEIKDKCPVKHIVEADISDYAKEWMTHFNAIIKNYPSEFLWQSRIHRATRLRGCSPTDTNAIIKLIEPMLCYKPAMRCTPEAALQNLATLRRDFYSPASSNQRDPLPEAPLLDKSEKKQAPKPTSETPAATPPPPSRGKKIALTCAKCNCCVVS
jgi:serine/threonine protein kinase